MPLRILQRYILREMALNFLGVTTALLAILSIYQLGAVLARAAELQYPRGAGAASCLRWARSQNVSLLLPFGLLLGVVLALGRLYHDSEMTAAQACGFGARALATGVALALPVALLSAWLDLGWRRGLRGRERSCAPRRCAAGLAVPVAGRPVPQPRRRAHRGLCARHAEPDGELQQRVHQAQRQTRRGDDRGAPRAPRRRGGRPDARSSCCTTASATRACRAPAVSRGAIRGAAACR